MRRILTATFIVAAIGLSGAPLSAAPASKAVTNATPLTLAQYGGGGGGYGGGSSCGYGYHYACWYDYYGYRHCGCHPND
jgi:hypothetical protein